MDKMKILLMLRMIDRLSELVELAVRGGEVTDADIEAAVNRADAADDAWADANRRADKQRSD